MTTDYYKIEPISPINDSEQIAIDINREAIHNLRKSAPWTDNYYNFGLGLQDQYMDLQKRYAALQDKYMDLQDRYMDLLGSYSYLQSKYEELNDLLIAAQQNDFKKIKIE